MKNKIRIVCFGDSNTWGYNPENKKRHDDDVRWTGRLQNLLGDEYQVVECGINGRTTVYDEPFRACRSGNLGLGYSMLESSPLDLLIVSLGTNDLKYADAPSLGRAMRQLLRSAKHSGLWNVNNNSVFRDKERILLISPIPLGADLDERFPNSVLYGKYELSLRFAEIYQPICKAFDVEFLDAAQYAEPSKADCIHMDADSHEKLAKAIYQKVLDIFAEK